MTVLLLAACSQGPDAIATTTERPSFPTSNPTAAANAAPATVENVPQATATPENESVDKPYFDLSDATLEHSIDPNCVDQFPQTVEAGQHNVVCFTFDEWVIANNPGQYPLEGGYEMLAGAEGWVKQNGQDIPAIISLVTANQGEGKMQVNGSLVQDLEDHLYSADEVFWSKVIGIDLGDTLWIVLDMPSSDLANNSTQGFGFEATPYTEDELNEFLTTGNFEIVGNTLWPVIDVDGRAAQQ